VADRRSAPKWPYTAARPVRRQRVVRVNESRGVERAQAATQMWLTPGRARLMLAVLLLAMLAATAWWMYRSPYLTVHEIEVQGTHRLTPQQVIDAAGIDGASTLTVDLSEAQQRVAALPGVRAVRIEKAGWSGATIYVEERTPWGAWQVGDARIAIDIDGHVLEGFTADDGMPVIVAANPQGVIDANARLDAGAIRAADRLLKESERTLGLYVEALVYREDAGLTAVLYGPSIGDRRLWVTIGDERDYDYKIAALYVLLEQAREQNVSVTAVDLRFGNRLAFN